MKIVTTTTTTELGIDDAEFDWATIPAADKVRIIQAMGFVPLRDPHTRDCPTNYGSGYVCNCVPEATIWAGPRDVEEFRGETWEQRCDAARARKGKA